MKKIIFYSLRHCNNPNLNRSGYNITTDCPIKWWENDLWADKKSPKDEYTCYITYIAYEDKD